MWEQGVRGWGAGSAGGVGGGSGKEWRQEEGVEMGGGSAGGRKGGDGGEGPVWHDSGTPRIFPFVLEDSKAMKSVSYVLKTVGRIMMNHIFVSTLSQGTCNKVRDCIKIQIMEDDSQKSH